jgi:hypothetical protein
LAFIANAECIEVPMTTKLEGELKREFLIDGTPYTLTIAPDRFVLALKGRRKGVEIRWSDLISGDAALATALNASLTANIAPPPKAAPRAAKSRKRNG